MQTKGVLVVVSGFSGAGKGTVMKALLNKYDNYALSVSATTRNPRPGEENGREYFFRTKEEFEQMIADDALIEHACYVGNYYGTPRAYVEEQLAVKKFWRLRGLLYFTDGYGVFPVKMPPYETAFIFVQNHYRDVDVPAWAIKLILQESDLENKEFQRRRTQ